MDWWLALRILCIFGCCVNGVLLSTARFRQWNSWSDKTKDHWWALGGWTFFGAYATIENIILDTPGGPRLIVLALVVAFTARALMGSGELRADSALSRKETR